MVLPAGRLGIVLSAAMTDFEPMLARIASKIIMLGRFFFMGVPL